MSETEECCGVCADAEKGIPVPCDPDGEPIHGPAPAPAGDSGGERG